MNLIRTIILLASSAGIVGCADDLARKQAEIPDIIEVFACSDYCPGPEEQYIRRVYEGVTDESECRELGGEPYTYLGWRERTVCEVK